MPNDTRTIDLVINNLTEEQFENVFSPDANELWLTPDDTPEQLAEKVDKTSEANKTYGTDAQGNQITYSTPTIPTVNDATISVTQNGVSVGSFTLNQASGDTIALTDTTYSVMTGATAGDAGTSGLVPAPAAGDQAKFLQGDGTWANPTATTAWGNITGTLSDQTDLQNALSAKADDNAVVHLTGAETITGSKTFQNLNIDQNIVNDSTNNYLDFVQKMGGQRRGTIRTYKSANDTYYIQLGCNGPNAEAPRGISVYRNASTTWTEAVAPASGDNSSKIATTAWVHSAAPNLAMPGDSYDNLTLGASGNSYTAPADGYFYINKTTNANNQQVVMINESVGSGMRTYCYCNLGSGNWVTAWIPAAKGQTIRITYSAGGTTNTFQFIYANGAS